MYKFDIISRTSPFVQTAGGRLLADNTLGIEVVTPELAEACQLGNVDPQHGQSLGPAWYAESAEYEPHPAKAPLERRRRGGEARWGASAVMAALNCSPSLIPPDGARLVTERPDLDSVAAMAVLALRRLYEDGELGLEDQDPLSGLHDRCDEIAAADNFAGAGEWRSRPLPTAENPWCEDGPVEDRRGLYPLNAIAQDRALSLAVRVAVVAAWLLGGEDPSIAACVAALRACATENPADDADKMIRQIIVDARSRVERARHELIAAMAAMPIHDDPEAKPLPPTVTVEEAGGIAVVRGTHPGAIGLGYCVAPVVVALNPAFRWPSGAEGKKATVAFFRSPGRERMSALAKMLNVQEAIAIADAVDLTAPVYPGCFFRQEGDGYETASGALARGDLDSARAIVLAATPEGVEPVWFESQRQRILRLLSGEGWGGNYDSGIIGSPMNHDTALSPELIVKVIKGCGDTTKARFKEI
jgi:hypothetical protein